MLLLEASAHAPVFSDEHDESAGLLPLEAIFIVEDLGADCRVGYLGVLSKDVFKLGGRESKSVDLDDLLSAISQPTSAYCTTSHRPTLILPPTKTLLFLK